MTPKPFVDIHTHSAKRMQPDCIEIVNLFPNETPILENNSNSLFSAGLHPWYISPEHLQADFQKLEDLSKLKNVVALGETGLDRLTTTHMKAQKEVFKFHLKLAAQHNKPVIVHVVRCYPEIIEIYKNLKSNPKLIFHGFRRNKQIAEQLIKYGFYLSFGESLLDPLKKESLIFEATPLKNIFLETDESKVNIEQIYTRAAMIKGITIDELKEIIFGNFNTCFGDIL